MALQMAYYLSDLRRPMTTPRIRVTLVSTQPGPDGIPVKNIGSGLVEYQDKVDLSSNCASNVFPLPECVSSLAGSTEAHMMWYYYESRAASSLHKNVGSKRWVSAVSHPASKIARRPPIRRMLPTKYETDNSAIHAYLMDKKIYLLRGE